MRSPADTVAPRRWLISERTDFWFSSAGASGGLVAAVALIFLWGDRQFDWLDLVFSELHLGATYEAVIRRRLWQRRAVDILIVPLIILVATFALFASDQLTFVTSIGLYAAIWHRGRQNFGVARLYQRLAGGPVSSAHRWLFCSAIYAPMIAAIVLYSHLVPDQYEGDPYYGIDVGRHIASGVGFIAIGCVVAYVLFTFRQPHLHPGERWVVLAQAVAFGSAYVLGAAQASFLFVLTVHHEVQYLYFTYAMARWPMRAGQRQQFPKQAGLSELRFAAWFAVWPAIGLAGAIASGWYRGAWLAPFGIGGLFCHYWLDGRIWTRRSMASGYGHTITAGS